MIALKKKLICLENRIDTRLERFVARHCLLGYLLLFAGMPLVTLAMVGIGTLVLAVPLGWLLGCM